MRDRFASPAFSSMLIRCERSKAYGQYCERVYGRNLSQFNAADMAQVEQLIATLKLNERSHVLDIGCGIGTIAEYISDVSGARITGIDIAQERTRNKAERLLFVVSSMDDPCFAPETFDAIIAIDTLYFANRLSRAMASFKTILKQGGQLALLYSQVVRTDSESAKLQADQTDLACALAANRLAFRAHDCTKSDCRFWRNARQVAEELRPEFEAEGNLDLCEDRIAESEGILPLVAAGRVSRYLYYGTR